jgi:hypothetical protein
MQQIASFTSSCLYTQAIHRELSKPTHMHFTMSEANFQVEITSAKSSFDHNSLQMNQDEPLVAFFNKCMPREILTASLPGRQNNSHSSDDLTIRAGRSSLSISFKRTVRVPDNGKTNNLPPGLGSFPLYNVADFSNVLPQEMVEKGGLFFAMYRKSSLHYMIGEILG